MGKLDNIPAMTGNFINGQGQVENLVDLLLDGGVTPIDSGKYGATIDTLLGNVSKDGMLLNPQIEANLVFDGVKFIASQALMWKFKTTEVKTASFPDLEKLHAASSMEGAFYESGLTSISFPKLKEISAGYCLAQAFKGTHLTTLSFPALETVSFDFHQFQNMLQGVNGCTVHFPAALEDTLKDWPDVQAGFGGTNTTILYDL